MPLQVLVLAGDDDVADDPGELHGVYSTLRDFDVIDDADDRGIDGTVLHARRHPRGAAADDEHGFADAGVHGVDGDQIVPSALPWGSIGRATSSLLLTSRGSFRVATTVPTMRARIMRR